MQVLVDFASVVYCIAAIATLGKGVHVKMLCTKSGPYSGPVIANIMKTLESYR